MPKIKDETITEVTERFYVMITSTYDGGIYYYRLTQDQINLLEELQECGLIDAECQIMDKEITWAEI